MAQEIKIPVSADMGPAEKAADGLATAFDGVADAVNAIDQASKRTSASLGRVVDRLREVQTAQRWLTEQLGSDVSEGDAGRFVDNVQNMRSHKTGLGRGLREFSSVEDWIQGHESYYGRNAKGYRQRMLGLGMEGTEYAHANGTPGPGSGGGAGGGGPGGPSGNAQSGIERAKNAAMGFGKSMLALAGINSVMGMAGRALDNSNEEAIGTDTLKRRLGDLGVDFEQLRDQARAAGKGLGVTYVESVRLGQAYAHTVGNLTAKDGIGGALRSGMGLSRAYGLDLEAGNQFYGQMAKSGVARDETSQRRLAALIGDAVARSGYSGKVDELLAAVSDYTATATQATLSAPNVEGFMSGLTSILTKGYAGIGPSEAAGMINQADASVRHGGAKGEASQNFMYNALRNFSPGLSPLQAQALWEGGLFSTNASTFGRGPLKGMGPGTGDMTTFEKIMATLRPRFKDPLMLAAAMGGITGQNLSQSSAMTQMALTGQLGASSKLLGSIGMNPDGVSVSGMQTLAALANAKGRGGIDAVYKDVRGRGDLTDAQRRRLDDAMSKGSDDDVRKSLARAIAQLDQEQTKGTETRNSIAGLNDTLTKVGGDLLGPINTIRDAVVATAQHFMPDYVNSDGMRGGGSSSPYTAGSAAKSGAAAPLMKMAMGLGMTSVQAAGLLGNAWAESKFDPRLQHLDSDGKIHSGMFQMDPQRWNAYLKWAKSNGFSDPGTHLPQLQYALEEMKAGHSEWQAGAALRSARDITRSTAAVVRMERPAGYHSQIGNYSDAAGWNTRLGAAQELYAIIEVRHPDGSKEIKQARLKPVATPVPAGARAPRVAGTLSYPTDASYQ